MGENDEKQTAPAIPAWQRDHDQEKPEETPSPAQDTTTLDVARRFLHDDQIKNTSREQKSDFLKTKGLSDEDIEKLLDEVEASRDDQPVRYPLPPPLLSSIPLLLQPKFTVNPA